MRLGESILRCCDCSKSCSCEEVETVRRDGKLFWVCPSCKFENTRYLGHSALEVFNGVLKEYASDEPAIEYKGKSTSYQKY